MPRTKDPTSDSAAARRWGVTPATAGKWRREHGIDVNSDREIIAYILRITDRERLVLPREREAAHLWGIDLSEIIRLNRRYDIDVSDVAAVRKFLMEEKFGW